MKHKSLSQMNKEKKMNVERNPEDYLKQIDNLPDSEWVRMKEHMDKKFPKMAMPDMKQFKFLVQTFGMSMVQNLKEERKDNEETNNNS